SSSFVLKPKFRRVLSLRTSRRHGLTASSEEARPLPFQAGTARARSPSIASPAETDRRLNRRPYHSAQCPGIMPQALRAYLTRKNGAVTFRSKEPRAAAGRDV